jgi:hypothetical protein
MTRICKFYEDGQPLFAKYMQFSQTVPSTFGSRLRGLLLHAGAIFQECDGVFCDFRFIRSGSTLPNRTARSM